MKKRRVYYTLSAPFLTTLTVMFGLLGCVSHTPVTQTQAGAGAPGLKIDGAKEGDALIVDGIPHGHAAEYTPAKGALELEPGKHLVEIRSASEQAVFKEYIFLSKNSVRTLHIGVH